jgi:hypothetical protein
LEEPNLILGPAATIAVELAPPYRVWIARWRAAQAAARTPDAG